MKRTGLVVLVLLCGLGGWIGWRVKEKKAEASAQTQQREARLKSVPLITATTAALRDVVNVVEAVGTVESPFNVKIAPRFAGRIEFLQVREGDKVTKGQLLVRLDTSQIEAQVRQQQASLAEARYRLAQAVIAQAPANASVSTQLRQQESAVSTAKADNDQAHAKADADTAQAEGELTNADAKYKASNTAVQVADANITNAKANLENAKTRYERLKNLLAKGFIAAQLVDDAKANLVVMQTSVDVALAQYRSAVALREANLSLLHVAERQLAIVKVKDKADLRSSEERVKQAQAALDFARANRAQTPAYKQNIEALKASVSAAEASLKSVEAQRAETQLLSPLDGYVTSRMMDTGTMATPGQPILAIQDFRQVWVTVPIQEEISRKVFVGQEAKVSFDALTGMNFKGHIAQINPSADPSSRQFAVRVMLENSNNLIKPGMFGRVSLATDKQLQVVTVLRETVLGVEENKPYVMVVGEDKKATRRPIVLGGSDSNYFIVNDGLKVGEKVINVTASPIKEGQEVKIEGAKQEKKK